MGSIAHLSNHVFSFLFYIFMNLTVFSWNCQGCASPKFPRIFREYNREHKPNIVSLLETRVSGFKVDKSISNLGFQFSHTVEIIGFPRGL
ncbi:hypothetical protein V6Z11_A06G069800 [Gossypium hirsutum]